MPDHQLIVFASSDDYTLGVLHSRPHEVWARAQGTQVRERESGFRYTPTTCFETFPFPGASEEHRTRVANAARKLNEHRNNWLNPDDFMRTDIIEFPGSLGGPWNRYVHEPDERGVGTVRYPRRVARDSLAAKTLAKRTLTNLYNSRPVWLVNVHRELDEAVCAAYGWESSISDMDILEKLLALNLEREEAQAQAAEAEADDEESSDEDEDHEDEE